MPHESITGVAQSPNNQKSTTMQPAPMTDDNEPVWPRLNVRDNRDDKSRAMRNWIANICQAIYCKGNSTDIQSRWTLSHRDLFTALKKKRTSIHRELLVKIDNFRGNYVLQTLVSFGLGSRFFSLFQITHALLAHRSRTAARTASSRRT